MSALKMSFAVLMSLSVTTACVDENEEGTQLGADGGFASVADATPAPSVADADVPQADATPASDPTDPTDPGDFPIELACSLDEIQPILECVTTNCLDSFADGSALTCVTLNCGLLLLTTPPECTQCLITGLTDTSMALDACVLGLDDLGGGFPIPPLPQP